MMIIASVCARGGSTRLPGKALCTINGISLLARAIQCAWLVGIDRVIVSTDDYEIAAEGQRYGALILMRPPELATDRASKWLVFRHLLTAHPADVLVDLDVGCPLRWPEDVQGCIDGLEYYDVVATAYESERNPYFNMVKMVDGRARVVAGLGVKNSQDAPRVYSLSPACYAMKSWSVFNYDHWSYAQMGIHLIPRDRAWDIDTPFDLEVATRLMEGKRA